jgi:hypothetical protein
VLSTGPIRNKLADRVSKRNLKACAASVPKLPQEWLGGASLYRTREDDGAFATRGQLLSDPQAFL